MLNTRNLCADICGRAHKIRFSLLRGFRSSWPNWRELSWASRRGTSSDFPFDFVICMFNLQLCTNQERSLDFQNRFVSNAFVKMSAICLSVLIYSRTIFFSSTNSLIKWCRISICLVLLCWTGFLKMLIALMLSQYKVITSCLTLYSSNICFIHNNWVQLLPSAIYSDSAVERATQFCFLLNHEIKLFPR